MRGLVLVLLIGILMFILLVAAANDLKFENKKNQVEFSTFTSAICQKEKDFVYCRDELFVNCNGNISKANGSIECNGVRFDASKVTGFAVFDKDWKDPRN